MEICYIDVPEEFAGTIIQRLSDRKGELQGWLQQMVAIQDWNFQIPSRGLIGYRGQFMTDTKGNGIRIQYLTDMVHTREMFSIENKAH